jgi:hypothetical protein
MGRELTIGADGGKTLCEMRLKFIVCKVMQREAYFCAARSGNVVDTVFMPQGLHDEADKLRAEVQKSLDETINTYGGWPIK